MVLRAAGAEAPACGDKAAAGAMPGATGALAPGGGGVCASATEVRAPATHTKPDLITDYLLKRRIADSSPCKLMGNMRLPMSCCMIATLWR